VTGRRERTRGTAEDPGRTPLVGRVDALRLVDKTLDRAGKGAFQLLELVGEPGVGKSRLLAEAVATARGKAMLTLVGRASEFERDAPLAALADALDDHLETLSERQLARLSESERRLLGSVFVGLSADASAEPADRYRLFRAVRGLLELLAESGGLVLVLDDVHWADESSVELLDHLLRHAPRGRIVVAVAYRPGQASPQLSAALGLAQPTRRVRIDVAPLTEHEADELLGPDVNRMRRQALYEASGGNPFYLEALSRMNNPHVPSPRDSEAFASMTAEVPETVRAALLLELTSLSGIGQLVAKAAAVVGDEFEPAAVAAAGEIAESEALNALDELVARDVVRPDAARFRFRHPLVRHAAYASAKAGWRMGAHGRAAHFLRGKGAQPQMLAHHVVNSAPFGDLASVGELASAAQAIVSRAPATAAHWLGNALRLLPDNEATRPTRCNLLLALANAQLSAGQLREGRAPAREALQLLPADDLARRAIAARLTATTERMLGSRQAAKAVLLAELRRFPDPLVVEAAPLYLRLAVEYIGTGEAAECARMLGEMGKLDHLDPATAFAAAGLGVMPAYIAGDLPGALDLLDEVDRLMAQLTVAEITPWMDVTAWLCWGELMVGRHSSALTRLDRVIEIARSTGQQFVLAYLLAAKAFALGRLGRLAEAAPLAEEACDIARLVGSGEALTMALTSQALILAWAGEYPAALKAASEGATASQPSKVYWSVLAGCARSLVLIYSRDLPAGRPAVEAACEAFESGGVRDETLLLICLEAMAHAEAIAGNPSAGLPLADRADAIRHPDHEVNVAVADLIRAHALSSTDPATSAKLALQSADTLASLDYRLEEGRARLRAGQSLAASGDRAAGLRQLAIAAELFATVGARGLHAQAAEAQRRLGQRVPVPRLGRRQELPFGLSAREFEVARLVVEGRTNAQIAERLSLSLRTVETHLTRVFGKTGVPARGGLGRVLGPHLDQN